MCIGETSVSIFLCYRFVDFFPLHSFSFFLPQARKLRIAIEQGREEQVVIKNYRRDGTTFWSRVQIGPMRDASGKITLIVGVQCEVRLEENIKNKFRHEKLREICFIDTLIYLSRSQQNLLRLTVELAHFYLSI